MDEIQAEDYLLQIPMWTKKKNSPEAIRDFLRELGSPQEQLSIIHVAGTNGKGSVCAFLASILNRLGYKTGSFTSPHLVDVKERIAIGGKTADRQLFQASFQKVFRLTERMMGKGYCHPSFFEYLFYMALVAFRTAGVRYAVLETGLGGRLDATNVIDHPLVTVITSISLDHMEYLGDTIELIAGEKAGIIKPGCPVVCSAGQKKACEVIQRRAMELSAPYYPVCESDYQTADSDLSVDSASEPDGSFCSGSNCFSVSFQSLKGQDITVKVPFAAPYQAENMLLAVRAVELLGLGEINWPLICQGIEDTRWPGRMEEVLPDIYLDGAHNIGGIAAFAEAAKRLRKKKKKRLILLFAVSADKEYQAMIRLLTGDLKPDHIVVAHMHNSRGLDDRTLLESFQKEARCPVEGFQAVELAYGRAMEQKGEDGMIFAVGSLYLIGEMKEMIRRYSHD